MKILCVCKVCGKEFFVKSAEIKKGGGKFCSKSCHGRSLVGDKNPAWKEKIKKVCPTCSKDFFVRPCQNKKGAKYCSWDCRIEGIKGKQAITWRGGKVTTMCKLCKNSFEVFPSRFNRGRSGFCSKDCYSAWLTINSKGKISGSKNPCWKGGITPITQTVRKSDKYAKWRQEIFIRDMFSCQQCGKKNKIEVHHKVPFFILFNECCNYFPLFDLYEKAMSYSPLWDVENGITLCSECHDKTKGRRKNKCP